MTEEEFANLSDDEIARMGVPPVLSGDQEVPEEDPDPEEGSAPKEIVDTTAASDGVHEGTADPGTEGDENDDAGAADAAGSDQDAAGAGNDLDDEAHAASGNQGAAKDAQAPDAHKAGTVGTVGTVDNKAASAQADADAAAGGDAVVVDYKAAYEKIMAPFKANGKEIKLQSPEEVVQLMQMGANYTKKLQALQPNLKLLKMLENNGLLDETKLNFLIDVDRKDPAAIQKLVKDSGIDPMDIDTQTDPGYTPGNHRVSDAEMRFTSTLEEVISTQPGKDLVIEIDKTWDKPSKDILWSDPDVLRVLTNHRQDGTFDLISTEIERRRMLGYVGNAPFLQTYLAVGRELQERGTLGATPATGGNTQSHSAPGSQDQSRVVETRVAPRKPAVANNDKARAASATRTQPAPVRPEFNPLTMSDEEFEKHAEMMKRL